MKIKRCRQGYDYSSLRKRCFKTRVCPENKPWNSDRGACVNRNACKNGTIYDTLLKKCVKIGEQTD